MRSIPLALVVPLAFLLAVPAGAEDCVVTRSDSKELVTPAGTFYTGTMNCHRTCTFSFSFWKETNGLPGLQHNETASCGDPIDTILPYDQPLKPVFDAYEQALATVRDAIPEHLP